MHLFWLVVLFYRLVVCSFAQRLTMEELIMSDSLLDFSTEELAPTQVAETNETVTETVKTPVNAFAGLGIDARIVDNLTRNDITTPTPIQVQGIPLLLQGKDLIACAPTGTGKTAAFVLPALQMLLTPSENTESRGARVVVLTPTRELAQQVSKASMMMAGKLPRMKTVCVTGGEPFRDQLRNIGMAHEILVATPGRLLDHISRGKVDLSRVEMFILDEADRMLDMGFSEDVQAIGAQLPKNHQTICFSATFDDSVKSFASKLLNQPEWLQVAATKPSHETIIQQAHYADGMEHKRTMLQHWLNQPELGQAVVFTATKRDAEELAMGLRDAGFSADPLHGDMVQRQRTKMIERMRKGDTQILVATDVASRGIDVPGITHVFNFDMPKFAEDYVHRIGRTGRAGRNGAAISFISRMDVQSLGRIEKLMNKKIDITALEGLEARFKPQESRGFGGGRDGGRGGFGGGRRDGGGYGGGRGRDGGSSFGGGRDGGNSRGGERSFGGGNRDGGAPRGDFAPRGDRPSFNRDGGAPRGDFAPRGDRPSFNRDGGAPRGDFAPRGDRPSFNRDGGAPRGDRPAFNRDGAAPRGDRFDSRTDSRFGDRPRFNRDGAASAGAGASTHHRGGEERSRFQDRDERPSRDGAPRPARHDRTERHH
jgi:superfamily II DNA/RNA helicase